MIESTSSGVLVYQKQVHAEDSSMRTLEGGRMDAPTTGVCGKGKGSTGRGANSPGRGGGSRGGGVAGSPGRGSAPAAQRILPPCRVCGLTATGFHYGANTCEACKAFFRRMVGRPAPPHYSCQGNCQPDQERGLSCPHCRLQRCQAVGMSLKAVKRGRYTHERKAQNILEVKQLSSPPPGPFQQNYDINSNTIKEPGYSWSTLPTSSTPVRAPACVSPIPSPGSSNASYSDSGLSPGYTPPGPQGFSAPPTMQHNPPPGPAVSPRDAEMDALVEKMVAVHRKYDELKPEHFKDRVAVEAKYKEERKLLQEMFGSMKPLDVEEYCRIYTETGVDVDGRLQEFIQRVVPLMEHRMYAHCAFLKALPGFKQLSSQDQIALMKASKGEDLMLSLYKAMDVNEGIYYDKDTRVVVDIDLIKRFTSPEFGRKCMEMVIRLQSYELTVTDQVLLKAGCFLCPDRAITNEGKENLEAVQASMVRELQKQLLENHSDDLSLTRKLMTILTELRALAYKLDIILARVHKEFKHLPIPASVKEIISPEGMAYSVPDVPFPGTSRSGKVTPKRTRSPKPEESGSSYLVGQILSDEPPAKRINWSFVSPPPNPNSIQQALGQTLMSHMQQAGGDNGLVNGGAMSSGSSSFSVHNILEKQENSSDSAPIPESRFIYPEHGSEYGPLHIAHVITQQPLKFFQEFESEPAVTGKIDSDVQQDTTERVITYENL